MPETGFSAGAKVIVEQKDDVNWEVREAFGYTGKKETFTVDVGRGTDFASVPRVFVWFLPRYGRYTLAAILHDYLWRHRAQTGQMDYIDADGTFRRAMRELGVPFAKRWIMWAAVRWGALMKHGGTRGWLRESWRVLLVTILALPILIPPAVMIGLALVTFFLLEMLFVGLLSLGRAAMRASGKPPTKQLNVPKFDWKSLPFHRLRVLTAS